MTKYEDIVWAFRFGRCLRLGVAGSATDSATDFAAEIPRALVKASLEYLGMKDAETFLTPGAAHKSELTGLVTAKLNVYTWEGSVAIEPGGPKATLRAQVTVAEATGAPVSFKCGDVDVDLRPNSLRKTSLHLDIAEAVRKHLTDMAFGA